MSTLNRDRLLVLATAIVTFFTGLGATRLWDEDEGFFAATAAEMHQKNDWIVPWYNGEVFAHKPPLMYWVMRLGFFVFGENEWGARFGSAVFGSATALLIHWIGVRLIGLRVGLLAGLAMSSCVMFGVVSRASTADAYLVFFMSLVIAAYVKWTPGFESWEGAASPADQQSITHWLPRTSMGFVAMYAAMGLAVLVKGPIGILLPGTAIGAFVLWQLAQSESTWAGWVKSIFAHSVRVFWAMRPFTAIATVTVVAGWWFAAVESRTGGGFLGEFLGFHNMQRFLSAMEKHSGPIVYYVPVVWIGFFPWSLFIIPSAVTMYSRLKNTPQNTTPSPQRAAWRLILCWFSVIFVFFSIAQTKLPNYTLPCYPPLAIMVAGFVSRWLDEPAVQLRFWSRWAFGSLAGVGLVILVALPVLATVQIDGVPLLTKAELHPDVARAMAPIGLVGLPILIGGVLCWRLAERNQPVLMLRTFCLTATVFCLGLLLGVANYLDQFQSSQDLAQTMHGHMREGAAEIASYHVKFPSLIYYASQPIQEIDKPEGLARWANHPGSLLVTSDAVWSKLPIEVQSKFIKVYERPRFPKTGTLLILHEKRAEIASRLSKTTVR